MHEYPFLETASVANNCKPSQNHFQVSHALIVPLPLNHYEHHDLIFLIPLQFIINITVRTLLLSITGHGCLCLLHALQVGDAGLAGLLVPRVR